MGLYMMFISSINLLIVCKPHCYARYISFMVAQEAHKCNIDVYIFSHFCGSIDPVAIHHMEYVLTSDERDI